MIYTCLLSATARAAICVLHGCKAVLVYGGHPGLTQQPYVCMRHQTALLGGPLLVCPLSSGSTNKTKCETKDDVRRWLYGSV